MGRERDCETTCAHSEPANFFPTGCRRAASFPFFGDSAVQASNLKTRSHSESEGLNRIRQPQTNIDVVRQRTITINEKDEGSEYDSKSSTSSSECGNDEDILCAGPLEMDNDDTLEHKKNVKFADECGRELFTIRIATEPSDCPPKLSPSVLRRYNISVEEEREASVEPVPAWQLCFKQPAAEYVKFRETLEKDKVSLENVILNQCKIIGTIKVSNIAFEKSVFVRYTTNGWASYIDLAAAFQPSTSKLYDTFKFELDLPKSNDRVQKIEFCICFTAGTQQYWDSNGGSNYIMEREHEFLQRRGSLFGSQTKFLDRDDAYRMDYTDWSKFAAWKSLSTDGPYW